MIFWSLVSRLRYAAGNPVDFTGASGRSGYQQSRQRAGTFTQLSILSGEYFTPRRLVRAINTSDVALYHY